MEIILSVIIPCYNHGIYIQEAIDSVVALKDISYEIIIVDDGSTDPATVNKIEELRRDGFNVLSHVNSGLAFSRNRGIAAAVGKYILPLDADNKIKPEYVYKAIPYLENGSAEIVYGKPILFGDVTAGRTFTAKPFNIFDLSIRNYIDACALFKKEVWSSVGGYDAQMPYPGQEDWEFWLAASIKGFRFTFLNEELFYYRIVHNSMIAQTAGLDKNEWNHQYIFKKHNAFFSEKYRELYYAREAYFHDQALPVRSMIKYFYKKYFSKTTAAGKATSR